MSLRETAATYGSYAEKYKSKRSLSQFYQYVPPRQWESTPIALQDNVDLCNPKNADHPFRSPMYLEQTRGHEFFGRPESPKKMRTPKQYANKESEYVPPLRKRRSTAFLESSISLSSSALCPTTKLPEISRARSCARAPPTPKVLHSRRCKLQYGREHPEAFTHMITNYSGSQA